MGLQFGSSAFQGKLEYPLATIIPRFGLAMTVLYGSKCLIENQTELFSHARQSVQV